MRAFIRQRELLAANSDSARKLDELERKHKHREDAIAAIPSTLHELMEPPALKRGGIGLPLVSSVPLR